MEYSLAGLTITHFPKIHWSYIHTPTRAGYLMDAEDWERWDITPEQCREIYLFLALLGEGRYFESCRVEDE